MVPRTVAAVSLAAGALALGALPAAAHRQGGSSGPFTVTGGSVTITFHPSAFGTGADTNIRAISPGKETAPDTFVFPLHGGTIYPGRNKIALSSLRGAGGLVFTGSAGKLRFKPLWGGAEGINDNQGNQLLSFNLRRVKITAHAASFTIRAEPGDSYQAFFGQGAAFNKVATVVVAAKGHR